MIGDSNTGKGFLGLQRYLLEGPRERPDRDRVPWTATRNLASSDPHLAAVQMRAVAAQAPRVEVPVYHLSLSAAPGETLSRSQWESIADRLLSHLGLDGHQVLMVAHDDTSHQHIHLMVNRVHPERLRAWRGSFSKVRIQEFLRRLEREMGLREVPGTLARLAGQSPPRHDRTRSRGEHQKSLREARGPTVDRWRQLVRTDLLEAESWADLEARLAVHGLRLKARGRGLVVTDGHEQIKISRLHRRASIHQLEARFGVSYRQWRSEYTKLREGLEPLEIRLAAKGRLVERHSRLSAQLRRVPPGSPRATRATAAELRRLSRLARRIDDLTEGIQEEAADRRLATLARSLGVRALGHLLPPSTSRALRLVLRAESVRRRVMRSR